MLTRGGTYPGLPSPRKKVRQIGSAGRWSHAFEEHSANLPGFISTTPPRPIPLRPLQGASAHRPTPPSHPPPAPVQTTFLRLPFCAG